MSARFVNENGPGVLSGPFLKFLAEEGEITQDALLRARSCGQPTILSRARLARSGRRSRFGVHRKLFDRLEYPTARSTAISVTALWGLRETHRPIRPLPNSAFLFQSVPARVPGGFK
jgi:hypothetical protein